MKLFRFQFELKPQRYWFIDIYLNRTQNLGNVVQCINLCTFNRSGAGNNANMKIG